MAQVFYDAEGFARFVEGEARVVMEQIDNLHSIAEQMDAALLAAPGLLEQRTSATLPAAGDYLRQIAMIITGMQKMLVNIDRDLGTVGQVVNHAAMGIQTELLQAQNLQAARKGRRTK